jgi:hypothetical protein
MWAANEAFAAKVAELSRAVSGAGRLRNEMNDKLKHIELALRATPSAPLDLGKEVKRLEDELKAIRISLYGDPLPGKYNMPSPPSLSRRLGSASYGLTTSVMDPTQTMRDQYKIVSEEFEPVMDRLKEVIKEDGRMEGWKD